MLHNLVNADVYIHFVFPMGRQCRFHCIAADFDKAVQIIPQCIAHVLPLSNIRRNIKQNMICGEHQLFLRAVQTHLSRCVPRNGHTGEFPSADSNFIPIRNMLRFKITGWLQTTRRV